MNILHKAAYDTKYYVTDETFKLPGMLNIINSNGKARDDGYFLFKFQNKSPEEKKWYYQAWKKALANEPIISPSGEAVLWLIDSPRMTHMAINEIVEAERLGYYNIIIMCGQNVDGGFFQVKDVSPMVDFIKKTIKQYRVKALITPCLNKVHNQILPQIDILKIGIQHGYGTWVEKKMIPFVDHHFNFGEISHREFDNPNSNIAGYSPTKLFDIYPAEQGGYILYLTQGKGITNKINILGKLNLLKLTEDFKLPIIIKEHADCEGEFKGVVNKVYSENEINSVELMRKARVVVTSWSGAGVESIFLNKPTVILDTQNDQGKFYSTSGLVVPLDYNKLRERVAYFLSGKSINTNDFRRRINHASGKVASNIILSALQNK